MRKIEVILADDLDGSTNGTETVEFSIGEQKWTLDLSKRHRSDMRKALGKFIEAAERASAAPVRAAADPEDRKTENARIREWARGHSIEVPARGRVPRAVVEQYEQFERNHTHVG